ncbi:DNA translocase FtsK 4TM domain-containing protein [bacterium]|nr:DNA translocase FtsK 4TM domain-containing protein [bacterium]
MATARKRAAAPPAPAPPPEPVASASAPALAREAGAIGLGLVGVLLAMAVASFDPVRRTNLIGQAGAALADVLVQLLGLWAIVLPIFLVTLAGLAFAGRWRGLGWLRAGCLAGALLAGAVLLQIALGTWRRMPAGGLVGGFLHELLRDGFGATGAVMIAGTTFAVCLGIATGRSLLDLASGAGRGAGGAAGSVWRRLFRRRGEILLAGEGEPILLTRSEELAPPNVLREREPGRMPERRGPVVVAKPPPRAAAAKPPARRQLSMGFAPGQAYCLPDAGLLDPVVEHREPVDDEALRASARVLERKLETFGVSGSVTEILPGPVITTYEFEPDAGIKVGRIVALEDDLAMAMRAMSVRIVAPIPGKSVVGIEVSNPRREKVLLREIVASEAFALAASPLTIALGKDTTGAAVVGDLARMPHLLVAGATGAGKSVFLNTLIASILMRATPRDVNFVMIDPKMLELTTYEPIPHQVVPVVTDAKPALAVLNNLVREMNERYSLMREKGVRNLEGYNKAVAEEAEAAGVIELEEEPAGGDDGEAPGEEEAPRGRVHRHLPRIVVIIDELADLILTRRDVELPITQLAQKARAAGIHLVVATQRPSVDILTGVIKANFPARISFRVRQKVDSRTILDVMGAENLLGEGDMLFLPPGRSDLQRLHGAYVSDGEIERLVEFVAGQEAQSFRMDLLADPEDEAAEAGERGDGEEAYDEMYDEAVRVVTESGKASISYVQRRLQVGYNRAARMIECMEREGVLSPADHRGVREILARRIEEG